MSGERPPVAPSAGMRGVREYVAHRWLGNAATGHYGTVVYQPTDEDATGGVSAISPADVLGSTPAPGARIHVTVEVIESGTYEDTKVNPWHRPGRYEWVRCHTCNPRTDPRKVGVTAASESGRGKLRSVASRHADNENVEYLEPLGTPMLFVTAPVIRVNYESNDFTHWLLLEGEPFGVRASNGFDVRFYDGRPGPEGVRSDR